MEFALQDMLHATKKIMLTTNKERSNNKTNDVGKIKRCHINENFYYYLLYKEVK